jgi:hypothetical protein
MNLVLDGAFEVDVKKGTRKEIGTCLNWLYVHDQDISCLCFVEPRVSFYC